MFGEEGGMGDVRAAAGWVEKSIFVHSDYALLVDKRVLFVIVIEVYFSGLMQKSSNELTTIGLLK